MTKEQEKLFLEADALRRILEEVLAGQKFVLDCGHHFAGGTNLGNNITIRNETNMPEAA